METMNNKAFFMMDTSPLPIIRTRDPENYDLKDEDGRMIEVGTYWINYTTKDRFLSVERNHNKITWKKITIEDINEIKKDGK